MKEGIVVKIVGYLHFLIGQFPKRIPNQLPIVLIRKGPPARLWTFEKKVILQIFYF